MKKILTRFVLYAAYNAGSRVTWGGIYQPKKPLGLIKSYK